MRIVAIFMLAIVALTGCAGFSTVDRRQNEEDPQLALDAAIQKGLIRNATRVDTEAWLNAFREKYAKQKRPPPDMSEEISTFDKEYSHTYVVLKKFTYPPGLIDENRAIFLIPIGVPEPSGDYGHSEIYDFETLTISFTAASPRGQRMTSHY